MHKATHFVSSQKQLNVTEVSETLTKCVSFAIRSFFWKTPSAEDKEFSEVVKSVSVISCKKKKKKKVMLC